LERPAFQIRPYLPRDFAAVCDLDAICFSPRIAYSPEEVAYFLSQRGALCLVAEVSEDVVAWILGQVQLRRTENSCAGHIVTIDVHPQFRRRKIGASLMDAIENEFRQRGCERALLEVATDNPDAQAFYQGRGYHTLRTLRNYYADGGDALRMELTL